MVDWQRAIFGPACAGIGSISRWMNGSLDHPNWPPVFSSHTASYIQTTIIAELNVGSWDRTRSLIFNAYSCAMFSLSYSNSTFHHCSLQCKQTSQVDDVKNEYFLSSTQYHTCNKLSAYAQDSYFWGDKNE